VVFSLVLADDEAGVLDNIFGRPGWNKRRLKLAKNRRFAGHKLNRKIAQASHIGNKFALEDFAMGIAEGASTGDEPLLAFFMNDVSTLKNVDQILCCR
jgi:hypothetical protein